ncbi:MAG: type II toxin-antitoxin system VapC family toxin [Chloroflexota bacterium]
MILYVDSSALIKRYVNEPGSTDVVNWLKRAELIGTALITRAEMIATFARSARGNRITVQGTMEVMNEFRANWHNYQHVNIDDTLVARADYIAETYALRGYDAIHLACALTWGELLGAPVTIASFDRELLDAAQKTGLKTLP